MLMLYGLAFCAVSLAIVWGTTLERIKFSAYVIYAIVFGAIIYPLIAHSVWGGGVLSDVGGKPVMDFAGSSVVHLTGAVGALAALLFLGPRIGKYDAKGNPRAIPGHSMPLVGLGVIILWIGWFGFNGGSTFETGGSFFGEVMLNTQLAAAAGVIGASIAVYLKGASLDVGMAGNGAIAGLVAITAPSGFVEYWAAPIIGIIAGVLVVFAVLAIDRKLDDPVGALSAHGLAGIWGTLAVGLFASPRLISEGAGSGV
jgi:Amt family ammonium transporter